MKQYLAAVACSFFVYASAQNNPIPAPQEWRAESFTFPLEFAPGIPYQGVEHVRFAPSWKRFDADDGFSYVFLWDVKTLPVTPADLENHLQAYFTGLMKAVGGQRKLGEKEIRTVVAAHPMAALPGWDAAYAIEVNTWNAFSKGEALLLHGEAARRTCGDRMQVFIAFSKSPTGQPIWAPMRAMRSSTAC
jgi:hypothetical protein